MSRWNDRSFWIEPAPKRPPPAHGIKMKRTGATWWGTRWLDALERMSDLYSNRLPRGRAYARAGRTHDLVLAPGEVRARVTGSRPRPYKVTIRIKKLDDATWERAIAGMAAKAQFTAELLAGEMPRGIDEAFRAANASLFPERDSDLSTECDCPDWANPCKHSAATHYVLGEALDKDPFLLFELRGRKREQVLAALREARAAGKGAAARKGKRGATRAPPPAQAEAKEEAPAVNLGELRAADYDAWRGAPPNLSFTLERPPLSLALMRQLGAPGSWSEPASPVELLAPVVQAASERALRLAVAGASDGAPERADGDVKAAGAMKNRRQAAKGKGKGA